MQPTVLPALLAIILALFLPQQRDYIAKTVTSVAAALDELAAANPGPGGASGGASGASVARSAREEE